MAHQAQDDGFHEIQLNGKQLVFVFMAATLLSVVIFLCGVLVGRGVQRERIVLAQTDVRSPQIRPGTDVDPAKPVVPPTAPPGADPTRPTQSTAAPRPEKAQPPKQGATTVSTPVKPQPPVVPEPPVAVSEGSRPVPSPTAAPTKPTVPEPVKAATAQPTPITRPAAEGETSPRPTATTGNGPQSGWVVQVASVDARPEADSIAKRLSDKGYPTFVLASGTNRFRVRVGSFKSKDDADAAAAKLRREERIEPWVTR